jgi:hypothetical protein
MLDCAQFAKSVAMHIWLHNIEVRSKWQGDFPIGLPGLHYPSPGVFKLGIWTLEDSNPSCQFPSNDPQQ